MMFLQEKRIDFLNKYNNLLSNYIKNDGTEKSIDIYYTEKIKATEKIRIDITKETDPVKKLDLALLLYTFLLAM